MEEEQSGFEGPTVKPRSKEEIWKLTFKTEKQILEGTEKGQPGSEPAQTSNTAWEAQVSSCGYPCHVRISVLY